MFVTPGLDPGIHVFAAYFQWPGSRRKQQRGNGATPSISIHSARLADISTGLPIG
jgi:hypothetical protein